MRLTKKKKKERKKKRNTERFKIEACTAESYNKLTHITGTISTRITKGAHQQLEKKRKKSDAALC